MKLQQIYVNDFFALEAEAFIQKDSWCGHIKMYVIFQTVTSLTPNFIQACQVLYTDFEFPLRYRLWQVSRIAMSSAESQSHIWLSFIESN